MMMTWLKRFDRWPKQVVVLVCICYVTAVGLIDYLTGYEAFWFTFYVLAVFLGTWRVDTFFGVLISALSVTAWVSANTEAGQHYANYFIPIWNAGIMFAIYLIIVFLLARLKRINLELEERVRLRTGALTREIQERVRLQKALLETSDGEQRRIGRDLHDGLCQHLTGTALAGHFLQQKLAAKSPAEAKEAERLVELIEQAIEAARNLSYQLDPVELKSGKLTDHLEDLAAGISHRFKVACRFKSNLAAPLEDAAVATHLYRIAQEAVTAAVRQNRAQEIEIGLASAAGEVVLTVKDNGAGRSDRPEAREPGGRWRAMEHRADLIGAKLTIERLGPQGTRVACVWPLAEINNDEKE